MEKSAAGGPRQDRDALIRQLAARASEDSQAREELARLVRETVEPYLRWCQGERHAHAVDDVCQEVWLAVEPRIASLCEPGDPRYIQAPTSWLRGVAVLQVRAQRRRERETAGWRTLERLDVPDPSMLDANMEGEAAIEKILQFLERGDRRIVELKAEGSSVEEITSELHISKEQYVRRMRLIRQQLAHLLPEATSVSRLRRGVSSEPKGGTGQ